MKPVKLLVVTLALMLLSVQTVAADTCEFVLGFATVRNMIPTIVGACIENEWHNGCNGDGIQRTTGGMMVWRKADNWTAFTDGYRTWINGPCGLQQRLNSQRFPWEPEIGGALICNAAPVPLPAGYVQPPLCGETPAPNPAPGAPTISYFNANPATITSGSSTTLSWDLSGATSAEIDNGIGGVAAPGTRSVSPGSTTTYTLTAHGTGGDTTAQVTVNVTGGLPPAIAQVTRTSIAGEDGRVSPNGIDSTIMAGDAPANNPFRAFMSFDLSGLAGKTIVKAELDIRTHTQQSNGAGNNPFGASQLGNMHIEDVQYGTTLNAADYSIGSAADVWPIGAPPNGIRDVTGRVQARVSEGRSRFQLRLRFDTESDNDGVYDSIQWNSGDCKLIITYQ